MQDASSEWHFGKFQAHFALSCPKRPVAYTALVGFRSLTRRYFGPQGSLIVSVCNFTVTDLRISLGMFASSRLLDMLARFNSPWIFVWVWTDVRGFALLFSPFDNIRVGSISPAKKLTD